ncbi:putative TIR domain, P-loop containing nucleoside triphosphate hydrolase [Helianthus annuus]|nr:putative TIR domain, P-loop containing nucleoside triphosphate hydrolase [Helianthus annuus]
MASSSQYAHRWKYDVFVSFRGEDIRKTFIDHLFSDFRRKGIYPFRDDKKLKRGEEIAPELYRAIEQSRFLIVIFSNDYPSSTWCMRELVKILECKKRDDEYEVRVLFYNVTPEVVKNQSDSYKEAFNKHEALNRKEVPKWKEALKFSANLSGWDLQSLSNGHEPKLIEAISKEIFYKQTNGPLDVGDNLVGLYSRADQMDLLQLVESGKVHMIGICGIGGIGKTTIAKAVFNLLHKHFEAYSFCEDIKGAEERHGLVHLQENLLESLMHASNIKIRSIGHGVSIIKRSLSNKKVLVVLDDVDDYNQLEALAGSPSWFGPGSIIIVTGRDKQLLIARGVEDIYEVDLLHDYEALELFSLYAFRNKDPKEEFKDLANEVVNYVKGLPLALKVLGSFLFMKTVKEWETQLQKLRRSPHSQIQQVLRISYDALDYDQRNIFLDISCFFKGENKDYVMKVLDGCDLFFATNIRVLIDKALVSVCNDRLEMHDLIQDMGRQIVHEESEEPGRRSRLWFPSDVFFVLNKDKGTEAVKGIALDVSRLEVNICSETFKNLNHLRLLSFRIRSWNDLRDPNGKIRESKLGIETKVKAISRSLDLLSSELRLFCWHGYPFQHLPLAFYPESLVVLDLSYSYIKEIWSGSKGFIKLVSMNLGHCRNLIKTPDFTTTPNLEELVLIGCENLIEIHPSVGLLTSLVVLNLRDCKRLASPPKCTRLTSLQILNMSGCKKLNQFPEDLGKMKALVELHADRTCIKQLPYSVLSLGNLRVLALGQRGGMQNNSLGSIRWPSVIPSRTHHPPANLDGIECLSMLETLNLSGNDFKSLPSLSKLVRLETLGLVGCKKMEALPELPPNIGLIEAQDCISLRELPMRSTIYESNTLCFDFTNSPKVMENQSVESLVTMLLPQGRIDPYKIVSVHLPGSRIPGWFTNQIVGDCIKVELPPDWCYEKFKGIAICLVFTTRNRNRRKSNYGSVWYTFKNYDDTPIGNVHSFPDTVYQYENIGINSDQMHLCYHQSGPDWEKARDFISVSFDVYGKDCVVKMCGARLVFEEDAQEEEQGSGLKMIQWLPLPSHAED